MERTGDAWNRRRLTRLALVAGAVIVVDQVSKAIVRGAVAPGSTVEVVAPVLRLVNERNSGLAGGRLAGEEPWLIISISLLAVVALLAVARALTPVRTLWAPLGLVLGGALGNVLDRIHSGSVTDFLVIGGGGPANLADQAILLGVVGMVLLAFADELGGARRRLARRTSS